MKLQRVRLAEVDCSQNGDMNGIPSSVETWKSEGDTTEMRSDAKMMSCETKVALRSEQAPPFLLKIWSRTARLPVPSWL